MTTAAPSTPSAAPTAVLGKEADLLIESFKDATVATGQIIQYCAIAKKQRSAVQSPIVPKTLSANLGSHLERYDQLCDIMNGHLVRICLRGVTATYSCPAPSNQRPQA
ncbi:hypothetical protein BS47DRAFT_908948 [Hydnum rufescens UP504]|uniref:Uncharacterized protein n=1 Tax=Hydnum rufescens UP504 TaxID=1448309 RepID=A0A9P6AXK7_9AGAM|nr:hypothetical protein BS47DRAFT_908948 [Hydnum rufescens UP504]